MTLPAPSSPISRWSARAAWFVATLATLWGALAVVRYGWRDLYADQWRLYAQFIRLPFPDNVLFLENGHRPVLPNLLRVAELNWNAGSQQWQLWVGLLLALGAVVGGWIALSRERQVAGENRAWSAMALAVAVFWLANARMLMHPNESVHTYLIVAVAVLLGGFLLPRIGVHGRPRAADAAAMTAAALLATFSFGPGMAVLPAAGIVLWSMRARGSAVLLPFVVMVVVLLMYMALPGGQQVRGVLRVVPLENAAVMLGWLGSPWLHLLEPFTDPGASHWYAGRLLDPVAATVAASLPAGAFSREQPFGPAVLSAIALAYLVWRTVGIRRGAEPVTRSWVLGALLAWFALGVAGIVSLSRLGYFDAHPGQMFANRYLPWPCLFWAGVAICWLGAARLRAWHRAAGAATCALALLLNPTYANWSQRVQAGAWSMNVALASDVFIAGESIGETVEAEVLAGLEPVRRHGVGVFGSPEAAALGSTVQLPPATADASGVHWTVVADRRGGHAWQVDFMLPDGVRAARGALWMLVDERGTVIGLAHPVDRRGYRTLRGYSADRPVGAVRAHAAARDRPAVTLALGHASAAAGSALPN